MSHCNQELYQDTFEQACVGIAHASFDGTFLRCNPRFAKIVGYDVEEIPGMTFQQIIAPEDLTDSTAEIRCMEAVNNGTADVEKRHVRKDGSMTWMRIKLAMQRGANGHPLHYIAVVEDINDRKLAEKRLAAAQETLRASEERYHRIFEMSSDGISITRLSDGMIVDCNQAYLDFVGLQRHEAAGKTTPELKVWVDPDDRHKMLEALCRNPNAAGLEARLRRGNGEVVWGQLSASLIEIEGDACILCISRDITASKAAEDKIRSLAFYDPLTRLPNRRLLLDRLHQSIAASTRSGRKLALLFVDLDNFKAINDTFGHEVGDLMLQEVAARLSNCIREADTVARLGGDEFVVMLEDLSEFPEEAAAQAMAIAEKTLASVNRPYGLNGNQCQSTSSIGIALLGNDRETASELLRQGDFAMYQAKAAGRNTVRFFSFASQVGAISSSETEEHLSQGVLSHLDMR
jgi:diguanylate cyclase (GGDEF)-like protein/PAS domain S-box-containing protein